MRAPSPPLTELTLDHNFVSCALLTEECSYQNSLMYGFNLNEFFNMYYQILIRRGTQYSIN